LEPPCETRTPKPVRLEAAAPRQERQSIDRGYDERSYKDRDYKDRDYKDRGYKKKKSVGGFLEDLFDF